MSLGVSTILFADFRSNYADGYRNRSAENSMTDTAPQLEELLDRVAGKPLPMVYLAHLLFAKGQFELAQEMCTRAISLTPNDEEVQTVAAEIFSHNVSGYYFSMVRDRARHRAYEMAMRRAIRPGSRVLELGTGTGLLAMMAARAGAAEVVTCENNPAVAAAASEVIARNGYADRIRVVAKHSDDLEVGVDLVEPADVLVWDILGSDMIGAGALPATELAVRRLMRRGAAVIPARGMIRVALAEDRKAHFKRLQIVEGFDLSPFNRLAAPSFVTDVGNERLALRSEPADLFRFDFQSGEPFPGMRSRVSLPAFDGLVNGVAQWLRFEMDDEASYENVPSVGSYSTFDVVFHPLRRPVELTCRNALCVCGAHDRRSLRIWAEVPERQ